MVATPGLRDDPVALAMIQDPELLIQLCDAGTVRRVVEAHPALAEAAHYIVAVVHEEAASSSTSSAPTSGYFYSLEALSDEEDMESSQVGNWNYNYSHKNPRAKYTRGSRLILL